MSPHGSHAFSFIKEDAKTPSQQIPFKWEMADTEYEIYGRVLDTIDLDIMLGHCINIRHAIITSVSTQAHLGPSLFNVFPRTLCNMLRMAWQSNMKLVDPNVRTQEQFDIQLKQFIKDNTCEGDRQNLIDQISKPTKPRQSTVLDFWFRLNELNIFVKWLPGEDKEPLTKFQLRDAFFEGMPKTWRDRFISSGQVYNTMLPQHLVYYFKEQERIAIEKDAANKRQQKAQKRNNQPTNHNDGPPTKRFKNNHHKHKGINHRNNSPFHSTKAIAHV